MNKRMNRAIWLVLLIGIFLLLCCSCGNSGGDSDGNSDGNGSVTETGSMGEAASGKCEHLFDDGTVLRAAGCDRDGEMRYTCSLCGYSYTKAIPGGHTPVKDPAVPATCLSEGKTEGSHCSVCGEVLTAQVTVPKTEHDPVLSPAVEATCSAEGNTEGLRCKNCGMMFTGTVIPKKAHAVVKDPAVPATCLSEGKTEGSHCSVCGEVLTAQMTVPKGEHTPVKDPAVPATCLSEGKSEGSHCSVCGKVLTAQVTVPKGGHTPVKDPAVPATCLSEGKTEGSHCSVCGKVLTAQVTVPNSGHQFADDWTSDGTYHWHASTCGHTSEVSGKAAHSYSGWMIDRAATEETVGEKHRVCTVCYHTETEEIPKLSHTHKFADDWTSDGTYHWHASTCGHTSEVSGKAAHSYSGWMIDRAATEETVGEKHRVCTVCYHTETEEIPKLSHTHKFADGWTSDDTYHWHASTCGHTSEVSGKAAHSYSDGVCSVCGAKDPRVAVRVYIDGVLSETLYTDEKQGYRITAPKKPADITTDPNAEGYFYAWFTDRDFQVPLLDTTEFRCNGAIYGKWIQIDYSCFTYTVSEGKATITKFNNSYKKATVVIVPAYINGFPVEAISSAFGNDTWLRTVILCNGIEKILTCAFNGCNSITRIDLPESLTEIGSSAFADCSILQDIRIPGNVKSIGDYAFYGCAGLQSITIPDGVTSIGYEMFGGCTGLQRIVIPDRVTSIGNFAFYGCSGLQSIVIPDSVTRIGEGAFSGCTGLQSITLPFTGNAIGGNYPFFGYIFGASEAISQDQKVPSSLKSVTITKNISAGAFQSCAGLQSITIPDSVTSIGNSTFSGCSGLQNIVIPDRVTSIGDYAFSGCSVLQSIAIKQYE